MASLKEARKRFLYRNVEFSLGVVLIGFQEEEWRENEDERLRLNLKMAEKKEMVCRRLLSSTNRVSRTPY